MLKFLLDEHVPPAVAVELRRHSLAIEIDALSVWNGGRLLGQADEVILAEAATLGLTLVTYDLNTIPRILYEWGRSGRVHAGVVFVSPRTISQHEVGRLVRALGALYARLGQVDWEGRTEFLREE